MNKKIYKISAEKKISGVCAGVAEYFNIDVTVVRILTAVLSLASFSIGVFIYIACALIMPDKSEIQ